jgi:hypothetical protein
MARHPRFVLVGAMMIRGNNRAPIFITNEDYLFYLEKLKGDRCDPFLGGKVSVVKCKRDKCYLVVKIR